VRLVLIAGVAWSGVFATLESYRTVRLYMNSPWTEHRASDWRLGSPPAESLRRLLQAIDWELAERSRISFAAPEMTEDEVRYARMWAVYLLPGHDIYPVQAESDGGIDYRLVWGDAQGAEHLEIVGRYPQGSLYRLP
jgi:hypothetical protein